MPFKCLYSLDPESSHAVCIPLILIRYVAGPNLTYKRDGRGVSTCELDYALGALLINQQP